MNDTSKNDLFTCLLMFQMIVLVASKRNVEINVSVFKLMIRVFWIKTAMFNAFHYVLVGASIVTSVFSLVETFVKNLLTLPRRCIYLPLFSLHIWKCSPRRWLSEWEDHSTSFYFE